MCYIYALHQTVCAFSHRHFEVGDKSTKDAAKLFSVPDFVGDACKAIASRIRGAVAGVQFDDFHKVKNLFSSRCCKLRLCLCYTRKLFMPKRIAIRHRTKSSRSLTTNNLPERLAGRVWWTKSQSSLLNIYFRLRAFQPSFLLIHFRYGSITCSHCTKMWHRTDQICDFPPIFEIDVALLHSFTEIAPKSPFSVCEQKLYAVWLSWWRKSYPLLCEHGFKLLLGTVHTIKNLFCCLHCRIQQRSFVLQCLDSTTITKFVTSSLFQQTVWT